MFDDSEAKMMNDIVRTVFSRPRHRYDEDKKYRNKALNAILVMMTVLIRQAHWCNSGMNIMGVSNHFQIGSEVHSVS